MRFLLTQWMRRALALVVMTGALSSIAGEAGGTDRMVINHVAGRITLRQSMKSRMELPKAGRELAGGEILMSGDKSRLELKVGEKGLWRVGRRAVFVPGVNASRLMAGTAVVRVPVEAGWRVQSTRGAARLGPGLWMVQAVDNDGLKIVCLDGPTWVEALGEQPEEKVYVRLKLRPGELLFLQPDGKDFGQIVTIYLEELLLTSSLVQGFPEPLPELRRLMNLGLAQREQLKGVTGAIVAGARDEKGFEIALPKPKAAPAK
jgi:hypothetical protein